MTGPAAPPAVVRQAHDADLGPVRALIAEAGLPLDGLDDSLTVLVAEVGGTVVGAVALERHGVSPDGAFLLRSAVVEPSWQNRGIGAALTTAALVHVDAAGLPVALLTETAATWFPRFGFHSVDRTSLPGVLEASPELRGACPASAQAMLRRPASS